MSFRFRHIVFWRSFVPEKFSGATLEKGKLDGVVVDVDWNSRGGLGGEEFIDDSTPTTSDSEIFWT